MTCPHGICYGLKWLLRHEGPRDHVDMIMNPAAVPNVVVVDMANMVVAHARNRGYKCISTIRWTCRRMHPRKYSKSKRWRAGS